MFHSRCRDAAVRRVAFIAVALLAATVILLIAGTSPALAGPPDGVVQAPPPGARESGRRTFGADGPPPAFFGRSMPNAGFTADLTYDAIYGLVAPYDVVTVTQTVGGAAYGSAQADGAGFFWIIPYDGSMNGRPAAIEPDDTFYVYVNGAFATALQPLDITGAVDVTGDVVAGSIVGLNPGTPITVTLGDAGWMQATEPAVVATSGAVGSYSASFAGVADIGPQMMAQVQYRDGADNTILAYVYPSEVFRVLNLSSVQGYAAPSAPVTVTVYMTYPTDVRWAGVVEASWPHGWYSANDTGVSPDDMVEVEFEGGAMASLDVHYIDVRPDAATDQITGYAPPTYTVRAYLWSEFDDLYAEATTTPSANWAYTLTLPADIETRHWPYAGFADAEGDELGVSAAAPHIRAYPVLWNLYAVAPVPHVPVTYTLNLASGTYVEYGWCGVTKSCDRPQGYELVPGDEIIAEFPETSMSMIIPDLGIEPNTAGDAVAGSVNQDGFLEATAAQWYNEKYPAYGWAVTTGGVSGAYNLPLDGFDVRDGMGMMYVYFYEQATGHRTFTAFNPWYWETPLMEVNPPYGVGGTPSYPDEFLTARLYDVDGSTLLGETSDDHDGDPWRFWFDDFQGEPILPARWVEVTGDSGWSALMQVPTVTLGIDGPAGLASGEAPPSELVIEYGTPWGWDSRFTTVHEPSGAYFLDLNAAGAAVGPGSEVHAIYQAPDGNRVRQRARIGELFRVEFWLDPSGSTDMWGEAQPGSPITITTPYTTVYTMAGPSGNWGTFVGDLFPGDSVTVVAAPGNDPITAFIPDPLTANADSNMDEVWGEIGGWFSQTVQIYGYWDDGYREVVTDLSGNFYASYPDVPRGGEGYIRFEEMDGYTWITFHRPFQTPDLILNVNYGHDWVEGNYEPGHTLWLTATDELGAVKATAELQTQQIPWWSPGQTGFSTNLGQPWVPQRPDLVPGDWIHARMDNGQTADAQFGEITGVLDLLNDTVSGNVYADWFTDTLYANCSIWEDNGPWHDFWVEPDGGSYSCDFAGEWDLLPGHSVGVQYQEPDGDWVINVFEEPAPDLNMEKWTEGSGQSFPFGPVVFGLRVQNYGNAAAAQVIVTDTLPTNAVYTGDSSGVVPTFVGNQVVWDLGPLDPGEQLQFYVYMANTASAGDWVHNVADAWALYDQDLGNNHAEAEVYITDELPDAYVNKNPETGDPAAGQTMLWRIDVGNNGPVASAPATLTDTIPAGTTIAGWWSENNFGWTVVATGTELALSAPSLPGQWGDQIYLRLALDPGLQPNTQLTNTVEVFTDPDSDLGNNWNQRDDIWVGDPRWDAGVYKDFGHGTLIPGGFAQYSIHVRNHGNMPATFTLTDLFPAGTSFGGSWRQLRWDEVPFAPVYSDTNRAEWDLGVLQPGDWFNLNVRLDIDWDTAPGAVLENCAQIEIDGNDSWLLNNDSCRIDHVNPPGPNLIIEKSYQWNWEGQLEYQINLRNVGTTELESVVLSDTMPAYTQFNNNWWSGFWEQVDLTLVTPGQLEWTFSRLEPGWSTWLRFQLDLDQGMIGQQGLSYLNIAQATIPGDVSPQDNMSAVTAYTGPDLYVEKTHTGGDPVPGGIVTFTVEFGNANRWPWNSDPEYGTHLTDTLPAGMTFLTATAPWNPDDRWHPEVIDGNTIVWGWGTQWSDSTWFFDIVAQLDSGLPSGAVLVNDIATGSDSPNDVEPRYDNNTAQAAITVLAPVLAVTKDYETTGLVGDPVTYTITVENSGDAAATNVLVMDRVPAGLTYVTGGDAYTGGDVTWTIAEIAAGGTTTVWFRATIDVAGTVTNDTYQVTGSDQGIGSPLGPAVTFVAAEPTFHYYLPIVVRGY